MHVKSTVFSQWRGGSFVSRLTEENGFGKSLAGSGQRGAVRMKAMLLRMSGGSMFPPYIQTFLPNLFAGRSSLNTVTGEQHETSPRFVSSRLLLLSPPVLADLPLGSSSMATAAFFSLPLSVSMLFLHLLISDEIAFFFYDHVFTLGFYHASLSLSHPV